MHCMRSSHIRCLWPRDADATGRKEAGQTAFCAASPVDPPPRLPAKTVSAESAVDPECCICAAFPPWRRGRSRRRQRDRRSGVRHHRPLEPALAQRLAEGPARPITGISEDAAKSRAPSDDAVDLFDRDFRLGSCGPFFLRHRACAMRSVSLVHSSGRNSRRPTVTGPLAMRASARPTTDSSPSCPARKHIRRDADRMSPFFGNAVSSTISHASARPTIRSASASRPSKRRRSHALPVMK